MEVGQADNSVSGYLLVFEASGKIIFTLYLQQVISFFRKIRLILLTSAEARRYAAYAMGEILLVMVGILLALQVNNWNENQKSLRQEQTYLLLLQDDFEENTEEHESKYEFLKEIANDMGDLLEQSELPKPTLSLEELNVYFESILIMPVYDETDRAYSNLTGAGNLNLLRSAELKNALAKYYAMLEQLKTVQTTHELELVETFQPYIIDNMDYQAVIPNLRRFEGVDSITVSQRQDAILDVLNTQVFRNIVTQKWLICTDLMAVHEAHNVVRQEILSILEKELGED